MKIVKILALQAFIALKRHYDEEKLLNSETQILCRLTGGSLETPLWLLLAFCSKFFEVAETMNDTIGLL